MTPVGGPGGTSCQSMHGMIERSAV